MIGSFLTRGLVMVFGYAYPAYECYKTVEKNKPEIEKLRFWCQFWILVAVLTVFERVGDAIISWVPMYSEAKLAFFVYLWYPKTEGTTYVYNSLFKPYVSKHENEIDRNLLELRARAGDMIVLYSQKAASYGQTRIFEILQYVAKQSTPRPQPPQKQQSQQKEVPKTRKTPNAPKSQPATKPKSKPKEPPSPSASLSLTKQLTEAKEERPGPSPTKPTPPSSPLITLAKAISAPEKSLGSAPTETEATHVETAPPESDKENTVQPAKESIMEETIRFTRGRLRKTRSAGTH